MNLSSMNYWNLADDMVPQLSQVRDLPPLVLPFPPYNIIIQRMTINDGPGHLTQVSKC